jgi:uncharacterized phiE125 gp8 family phage protein
MALQVITQPAYEPISLAEAKGWLNIEADVTIHDAVLRLLIKAMREMAENLTFRAFISRQLRLTLADWPYDREYGVRIELPSAPLLSVESLKYRDTDGVLTTLATDQYDVYEEYEPGLIVPAYLVAWPTIRRQPDAVQVSFTAGYAPGSPSDEASNQEVMPGALRLWMQTRLATLFENRETIVIGGIMTELPRSNVDALLDPLVVGTRLF